jgi:hypothetical protein
MSYYSTYQLEQEARLVFGRQQTKHLWNLIRSLGQNMTLCSFRQVYQRQASKARVDLGIQQIPVDCVIGSVSDNHYFDNQFYPRLSASRERWTRLYTGYLMDNPIPPITVYRIHDMYFVEDGHHRISVARAIGQLTIAAHVIAFRGNSIDHSINQEHHHAV